jgi:DNA-binding transcriptional regulator YdaS (Cro superfamily)
MKLRDYLHFYELTKTAFARSIDISPVYIQQICKGKKLPSKKLCRVIERETNGEVTLADLIPLIQPREEEIEEEEEPFEEKIG